MNIGIRYNFLLFIIQIEILILELDDKILTKYNTYRVGVTSYNIP